MTKVFSDPEMDAIGSFSVCSVIPALCIFYFYFRSIATSLLYLQNPLQKLQGMKLTNAEHVSLLTNRTHERMLKKLECLGAFECSHDQNTHTNVTKITWKGFALSILIVYGKWDLSNEFKQMCCFIISPHGFVVQVRYVNLVICTYLKWKCFIIIIIIYEKGTYIYSCKTFFWDLRKFFKKSLYVN